MRNFCSFIRLINRVLENILLVLCLAGLVISLPLLKGQELIKKQSGMFSAGPEEADILAELEKAHEVNPDVIGWIEVEDTGISSPVVKSREAGWYVSRGPDNSFSALGSIFMENGSPDFTDSYTVLYGHSATGLLMFTPLLRYEERDYFNSHQSLKMYVLQGRSTHCLKAKIFACAALQADNPLIYSERSQSREVFSWIEKNCLYVRADLAAYKSCRILALSTCMNAYSLERMAVFAAWQDE